MSETEKIVCSFCGRNKQDTNILIAGNTAHICDACIEQAHDIVKEDIVSQDTLSDDFRLLKPKAIKNHLDDFVIGQDEVKKVIDELEFKPSVRPDELTSKNIFELWMMLK